MTSATILLADDQDDLRRLLRLMLARSTDWTVVEASDGDQAVKLFRSQVIDLAVLDQRMPGCTGTQAARLMREEDFTGPILLFSAYLDENLEAEAEQLGLITVAKGDITSLVDRAREALAGSL